MPRKPSLKPPDPTSVRVARVRAKNIAAGNCRTGGSKHGAIHRWDLCLLCFAKEYAPRVQETVERVLEIEREAIAKKERERLEQAAQLAAQAAQLAAQNDPQLTLPVELAAPRAPANDQAPAPVTDENARRR